MEAEAVKQIGAGSPVTLIGHSTGGLVALGVAARLPHLVRRVVSIDGVVWGPLTGLLGFAHWLLNHRLYAAFWVLWAFTQINPWAMMYGVGFYAYDQKTLEKQNDLGRLPRHTLNLCQDGLEESRHFIELP